MDALVAWAKENFELICLLVGMAGVLVSIVALIHEIKVKRRNGKK